ncbi:YfbU family protein, partial [Aeromonas salmonicida]
MNMSHTERLILSNQYEILAKLNPEKAASYQRASTIIARGYCLQILELEKSFGHLDLATCQEVIDTLELHHALAISWGNLDGADQSEITASRLEFNGYSRSQEREL